MSPNISGKPDDEASLQKFYVEQPFIKHQLEEVIDILCHSEDPKLMKAGYEMLESFKSRQRGVSKLDGD